jgi:hypothetical protein
MIKEKKNYGFRRGCGGGGGKSKEGGTKRWRTQKESRNEGLETGGFNYEIHVMEIQSDEEDTVVHQRRRTEYTEMGDDKLDSHGVDDLPSCLRSRFRCWPLGWMMSL